MQSFYVEYAAGAVAEGSNLDCSCTVKRNIFSVGVHSPIISAASFACCTKDDNTFHALDEPIS